MIFTSFGALIVTATFFWRISQNPSERSEFEFLTHPCDGVTSGAACLDKRADRLNDLDAINLGPRIEKVDQHVDHEEHWLQAMGLRDAGTHLGAIASRQLSESGLGADTVGKAALDLEPSWFGEVAPTPARLITMLLQVNYRRLQATAFEPS